MANTVNDVMNVIASPDYGIKNIAGTTHEILAIMQGTHNSQNNIHSIVDDVRNLLQKLVDVSTEQKPIEVGDKSTKINHKHIESILDETKGIRKAIDNLTKAIAKQGGKNISVAKLTDKASQKVANAMIKNMERQNKGGGMAALVDAFTKLKDISLTDIIIGNFKLKKITKLFKNAKKDLIVAKEDDIKSVIKLINAAPEMIESLRKVSWRINRIIKNETIKKLGEILVGKENSLLTIARSIQRNEKTFINASKTAKNLKEIISLLNGTMIKLLFASLFAKLASGGIKSIEIVIDKLIPLTQKLIKNQKDIEKGTKVAKNITILVGNLLLTSIFLTIALAPAVVGILGALALWAMVNVITKVVGKISESDKHINKANKTAFNLMTFTGMMAITSLALATIAVTGIPAILGALLMFGIVKLCSFTFKMLSKASKNVLLGSLVMLVMSTSLILFGIGLQKITDATKNVSWKQFGIIAATTGLFAVAIGLMGIPPIAAAIALGSIVMIAMSFSLLLYGAALNKITKATKNINIQNIKDIAKSIRIFGRNIALLSLSSIAIGLGSIALDTMSSSLLAFAKSFKIIKDMGGVPINLVYQVLNAIKEIGKFFTKSALKRKAIKKARLYSELMIPFRSAVYNLSTLKKIGSIPMKLVFQTLNAMSEIGEYYKNNPIEKEVIKQAKMYKRMLRPFGKTIKHLVKLKQIGTLPMKLVYQTLNTMSAIADYYVNNPIDKKTIKQAKRYKKMLRPFGKTIKYLTKLKKMGTLPMKLVFQTLNAMTTIADYYVNNPIRKKAIKQAKRYKKMLKPFGKTIKYLSKLKEMGSIPMKLVFQTLNAMSLISDYYANNPIDKKAIKQSRRYRRMLKPFGKVIEYLAKLKEMGGVPTKLVENVVLSIGYISDFYSNMEISEEIEEKSAFSEFIVNKFTTMAKNIQDRFEKLKRVDFLAVGTIILSCRYITNFYSSTKFFVREKKIDRMNYAIEEFTNTAVFLKESIQGFTQDDYKSVKFAVKSMKRILKFLKRNTLNKIQRNRAQKNLTILKDMASTMSNVSKINPLNISSIGDALSNALSGVHAIDMDQVVAVTNMFNAFNGINKSENIINKFTESVKEFTETCKNLMEAMGENTEAINNMDGNIGSEESVYDTVGDYTDGFVGVGTNTDNTNKNRGIHISNVDELARKLAERINGVLSVDVPDTQVQLLINGTGGNEWTITRY